MKFATVVTTAGNVGEQLAHTYLVTPADEAGEPQGHLMGRYAKVRFEIDGAPGCSEGDLIGIAMHRLATKAQLAPASAEGYSQAVYHLDQALAALSQDIQIPEVESLESNLAHLATERVQ